MTDNPILSFPPKPGYSPVSGESGNLYNQTLIRINKVKSYRFLVGARNDRCSYCHSCVSQVTVLYLAKAGIYTIIP